MDSNRKKLKIKWRRTAIPSPALLQERNAGSGTPSRWNIFDSNTSPYNTASESPGPDGLGAMSLDTPKRKAVVLGDGTPSLGKLKLRKLSQKKFESFTTPEVNLILLFSLLMV